MWFICQSVVLPVLIDSKKWRSARTAVNALNCTCVHSIVYPQQSNQGKFTL